jgi:ribosome-binding protein aMBF1 (putative translation factor)
MEAQNAYLPANVDNLPAARSHLRPVPIDAATTRYVQERLGRAIRLRRRMMDLTLQDLAGACGVTFQQVHKYESGLCSLSASQLWAIAQALEVPVTYFYENLSAPDVWGPDGAQVA